MSQQTLPRRRVASPPLIPTAEISRLPVAAPHLWPNSAARNASAARSNIGRAVAADAADERDARKGDIPC